jgi:4-alpha-glucanotransferase
MRMSRLLDRAAAAYGIERAFVDSNGRLHLVSPDTKRALLRAMSLDPSSPDGLREAVAQADLAETVPPVLVVAAGEDSVIALPALARSAAWRLDLDGGDMLEGAVPSDPGRRGRLLLPAPLPVGYHRLKLERSGGQHHAITIVAAPRQCPLPEALGIGRVFGLGCRVRSLRSARDLGSGDLADLGELVEIGAREGADFLAVEPLHAPVLAAGAAGPDTPSNRAFLSWLLIAPDHVAEVVADPTLATDAARAREEAAASDPRLVDDPAVAGRRRRLLEAAWRRFSARELGSRPTPRGRAFAAFRREGGEPLRHHCLFEALQERERAAWWDWPEPLRGPDRPGARSFAAEHEERLAFLAWLQWLADQQLADAHAHARESGMRLGLYRELAVGVGPKGSLAWSEPDVVARGASIGAPPEPAAPDGQDWGLAPLAPRALEARSFAPWLRDVRASMRHAGVLRLAHAMGLRRLFWIPAGGRTADGAYVRYPFTTLLALLAVEAHRQRCLIVGEDHGVLPRGFRPALRKAGVLSSRVLYFERERNGGFGSPRRYRHASVASLATGEHPTLRGFLEGRDLARRERLGLFSSEDEAQQAREERQRDRTRLLRLLQRAELLPDGTSPGEEELMLALHRWLARTPAALLLVQLDDLARALEPPDLPDSPGALRRLEPRLEAIFECPFARRLLADMRTERPRRPPTKPARVEPEAAHDVLFHDRA